MVLAATTQRDKWVLTSRTGSPDYGCALLGLGLIRDKYVFSPPREGESKSAGFRVDSISSSGRLEFVRVETT